MKTVAVFYLGHYVEQNKQKMTLGAKNRCHQVRIKSTLLLQIYFVVVI